VLLYRCLAGSYAHEQQTIKMIVDFRHAPTLSSGSADRRAGQHLIAEMVHYRSDSAGTNVKEN